MLLPSVKALMACDITDNCKVMGNINIYMLLLLMSHYGNELVTVNEVGWWWAPLVVGLVTAFPADNSSRYVTSHTGQLSLAIPLWVGARSTDDGYGHR